MRKCGKQRISNLQRAVVRTHHARSEADPIAESRTTQDFERSRYLKFVTHRDSFEVGGKDEIDGVRGRC